MTGTETAGEVCRLLTVPSEDAMFGLLSALNVSGVQCEVACATSDGSSFLATLTDPDADYVNYIYSDESGLSRCVIGCENCGTSGRSDDWTPRYPVTALLAVEPDAARAREDEIDPWWEIAEAGGACASCGEGDPTNECPKSERPCGHHCNHIWENDFCHWCGTGLPAAPTEARGLGERVAALAEVIWHASRADESTISATGADIVARAVLDAGYVPGDSLMCCPECGSVFEAEDNTVVCDHAPELSAKRLAEAAAPETEGPVAPCSRKDAHDPHEHWDVPASEPGEYRDAHICRGIEPFPTAEPLTAQPAAEGAREDDGLDDATSATVQFDCGVCRATQDYCDTSPDGWCCDGCCSLIGAAHGDEFTDWLAEDRRRARAEGGAGALEEAGGAMLSVAAGDRSKSHWRAHAWSNWLRDRAAGMRETGGKG